MGLTPGSRVGSYELVAPLGAGGMGEVWRARDTRLGREVALKILPGELAEHHDRRRRFEQEARAASALNHPHIVTVYEIGSADGTSYIAMELVTGKTLRQLTQSGPLPARKLLGLGAQIASGLARAHAEGIVHRDLKPDNVMVTPDGVAKILDFGLAKLVRMPTTTAGGDSTTATVATEPGVLLGTYGYMSPEQAAGKTVDFRSDQFSFGSILYELATGQKAFRRDSAVDTLSAVLHEEPLPIAQLNEKIPAPVRWIVERCHAKDPKDRYASTEDLARELQSVREHLSDLSSTGAALSLEEPTAPSRRWLGAAGVLAATLAVLFLGLWLGRRDRTSAPRYRQLTQQSGAITTARFTPDGQSVVYATQWEGKRPELFETRLDHAESRPIGLPSAQVLSISRSGYLAIDLLPPHGMTLRSPNYSLTDRFAVLLLGTLAQVPLAGGAPRELLENVADADWAPNGTDLAVARFVDGKNRLEYPIGRKLFESFGWIAFPRVSPDGNRIAFSDQGSHLFLADRTGKVTPTGLSVWEHAWSPVTGEILYVDTGRGATELRARAENGKTRLLARLAGTFTLYDVSSTGAVLMGQMTGGDEIYGSFPGESRDRRLFDDASLEDVSAAGDLVTFTRGGLDEQQSAYLGKVDGSAPKRLGALGGYSGALLSPDGRFVAGESSPDGLIVLDTERSGLVLVPTGAGQAIRIPTKGIESPGPAGFSSDGKKIYLSGEEPGRGSRLFVQDLESGKRLPLSPESVRATVLSPDGSVVVGFDGQGWSLYPTAGGPPLRVAGILAGEEPIQWTSDGSLLYVRGSDEVQSGPQVVARVYRLDPRSGHREPWKEIPPVSPSTGGGIGRIGFSADGKTCFYTHHRISAELYLVEGVK